MKTCKEPRKLGSLFLGVRSLAQKVRDFIVDFVDRLKQYAVDYAVDQDRTEILAMQSREQDAAGTLERIAEAFDRALEQAQGGDGAAYSLRKGNEIDLSSREYALFREKIAEIKIGKSAQFPKSANGEYILAIDNKLVYTDGEFVDTHVSQITELNFANETMTDMARGLIFDYEQEGIDGAELQGIIESVFGEGCIKTYSRQDSRGDGRQNGRGKERDYEKVRKNNHGDLSSPGKRKFSLKNESADKVDVDQTLRAGNSSMAGQTETEEQTRHTPVDVTETMRQWADKRAGQIIREYRSAIDGESVREDMARLVNELAENGASSDALNATVNMAKGIIEKRYCRKYDDVCAHAHIPIHVSQGTTVGVRQRHDGRMISIHATCGRRPVDTTTLRKIARFQPTLPSRGATLANNAGIPIGQFQSTLPSRGATLSCRLPADHRHISIHAPLTGSDRLSP